MGLYLSPYRGAGTRKDPFRPLGVLEAGASAIDIRLDPTKVDGDGIGFALVWLDAGVTPLPGMIKLADDYGEGLAAFSKSFIATRTGLDFSRDEFIQDIFSTVLFRPDNGLWRALRPSRPIQSAMPHNPPFVPAPPMYEAWLGSSTGRRKWLDLPALAGGSLADNFERANETPLASPWTALGGTSGSLNLSSNAITSSSTNDAFYYYNYARGWQADQYSEWEYVSSITNDDWGPAVRIGDTGVSAYVYEQTNGGRNITKWVSGTRTVIEAASGATATGTYYRITVSGSTIVYSDTGVANANSPATDTSLAGAGSGAGIVTYESGGSFDGWYGEGNKGITLVAENSNGASNGGDVTVSFSGMGLQENDLVLATYAIGDNDNVDENLTTITSGYTELADLFANDSQDTNMWVGYKFMGATPDSDVVFDGLGGTDACAAAVVWVFRYVDTGTPIDVTTTTATGINTAHANPPSLTRSTSEGINVSAVAAGHLGSSTPTLPPPLADPNRVIWGTRSQNDTSDVTSGLALTTRAPTTYDPAAHVYSGTDNASYSWCAAHVALRAAAWTTTFTYTPSGGITFGGTAPKTRTHSYDPSGGITFGGTAPKARTHSYDVSGGIVFGGAATTLYVPAGTIYTYTPSGGIVFGGTAPRNRTFVHVGSGGLVFGGSATTNRTFVHVGSGGLTFGGTAPLNRTFAVEPSGGIVFGGTAPRNRTIVRVGTGGVVFGGSGNSQFVPVSGPTGNYRPHRIRRK